MGIEIVLMEYLVGYRELSELRMWKPITQIHLHGTHTLANLILGAHRVYLGNRKLARLNLITKVGWRGLGLVLLTGSFY